jgi:hypothetical protein
MWYDNPTHNPQTQLRFKRKFINESRVYKNTEKTNLEKLCPDVRLNTTETREECRL